MHTQNPGFGEDEVRGILVISPKDHREVPRQALVQLQASVFGDWDLSDVLHTTEFFVYSCISGDETPLLYDMKVANTVSQWPFLLHILSTFEGCLA